MTQPNTKEFTEDDLKRMRKFFDNIKAENVIDDEIIVQVPLSWLSEEGLNKLMQEYEND
jgi:hypothetical protein